MTGDLITVAARFDSLYGDNDNKAFGDAFVTHLNIEKDGRTNITNAVGNTTSDTNSKIRLVTALEGYHGTLDKLAAAALSRRTTPRTADKNSKSLLAKNLFSCCSNPRVEANEFQP